jgi:hypothetical protein
MKQGIILFALQGGFDYIGLAVKAATRIKEFSSLPISVITDSPDSVPADMFDQIIEVEDPTIQRKRFHNGNEQSEVGIWKNSTRCLSYNLTPYEHTLVLDSDYIVNSDFLFNCFSIDKDFLIFKNSYDLAGWRDTKEFEYVNQFSVPFYWATVFMFKKTPETEKFFQLLLAIRDNWEYYRLLYQIVDTTFRNDYAFSIAIHIFYSSKPGNFDNVFPSKMYYIKDRDHLVKLKNNTMLFALEQEGSKEYMPLKISNIDVHVMNKYSIMKVLP